MVLWFREKNVGSIIFKVKIRENPDETKRRIYITMEKISHSFQKDDKREDMVNTFHEQLIVNAWVTVKPKRYQLTKRHVCVLYCRLREKPKFNSKLLWKKAENEKSRLVKVWKKNRTKIRKLWIFERYKHYTYFKLTKCVASMWYGGQFLNSIQHTK